MNIKAIKNNCLEIIRRIQDITKVNLDNESGRSDKKGGHFLFLDLPDDRIRFKLEIRGIIKRPLPDHWRLSERKRDENLFIMAEYVNDLIGEDLRKNGICFMDCLGNACIHVPGRLYVSVQGKKLPKKSVKDTANISQPKGLQLLFILLAQPDAANLTMRKLAEGAGISIDRTHAVIHELMDKGYLIRSAKGMKRLKNRKKLFELWLANFGGRLRPKLILGTYKMAPSVVNRTGELLQQAFPDPAGDYAIGGGLAGYLLDHYYRGPTTEIFVKPEAANRVRSALKLIPARDADTTLFNLFSPGVIYRKEGVPWPVVHPMLIYAELLHQGGDRALDAAGRIDDACLKQVLDEE